MNIIKILSLTLLPLIISSTSYACNEPSTKELRSFFDGSSKWTEVESSNSNQIATKNPIFLNLDFNKPQNTTAKWGNKTMAGKGVTVCKGSSSKTIILQYNNTKLTFTKLSRGIIKSQIPMVGQYYYRPNADVKPNLFKSDYQTDESPVETSVSI